MSPLQKSLLAGGEMDLCFPLLINDSCRRLLRPQAEATILYVLLFSLAILTVLLNLLVIVSISHFRQLHTPSNLVLLSLACSDVLVGLLVMPLKAVYFITTCWFLGQWGCALFSTLSFVVTSASVGNILLVSVDRYMAICQPLHYTSKVTLGRVQLALGLCWACSVLYNCTISWEGLRDAGGQSLCQGTCVVNFDAVTGIVDLVVTLLAPVSAVVVLYLRVFSAVLSQTRQMRRTSQMAGAVTRRSEKKAAVTLGVVVVVFLLCFCPFYYPSFTGQDMSDNVAAESLVVWLLYVNSCLNPLMYTLFYSWFRKAIRLIISLQILQPDSCMIAIF